MGRAAGKRMALGFLAVVAAGAATAGSGSDPEGGYPAAAQAATRAYGEVPLGFEANRGQSDPAVRFLSRGSGYGLFLTPRQIVLAVGGPSAAAVIRLVPLGASRRVRLTASGALSRRVNHLVGRAGRHRTGISAHRRVVYDGLYPGIDLVVHGDQRALEYDFVVAPGASPKTIRLAVRGARDLKVSSGGALLMRTPLGVIRQRPPVLYQRVDGARRRVTGRFTLRGSTLGFRVGAYDRTRPLVIDPVIDYSTFLGGLTSYDQAQGLAVDANGNAYVAGLTFAADFPTTSGALSQRGQASPLCAPAENPGFQPPPLETCRSDAFVSKLDPSGSDLVYSTFLGGSLSDRAQEIDVDASGAAFVTGGTDSGDFPVTTAAVDRDRAGARRVMGAGLVVLSEAFAAKLSPDGARLEYATFLGGADAEEGMGVKAGPDGTAFVAGHTFSADHPVTPGAFDTGLNTPGAPPNVCSDVFVTRIGPSGDALRYSTFIGGSRLDFAWDLDVDPAGAAYVMAESTADDAPTTPGAFQPRGHLREGSTAADCSSPLAQFDDADPLVVKLAPDGSALDYATYLGGTRHEHGLGIAQHDGHAYVVGHTNSHDFPTTSGAFDRTPRSTETLFDGFVAKLSRGGDALAYSTLLGGAEDDWVFDVDVDAAGSAFLTGMTASTDFPKTPDALDSTIIGPGSPFTDAFLTRMAPDGSRLLYSSYVGGSGPDVGLAIEESGGSAYIAGLSYSPDMVGTARSFAPVFSGPLGYSDAFVARFSGFDGPAPAAAGLRVGVGVSVKPGL